MGELGGFMHFFISLQDPALFYILKKQRKENT